MIAVLTGEIIHSRQAESTSSCMESLEKLLVQSGASPEDWQIFQGDRFLLKTAPEESLRRAVKLSTYIRMKNGIGARIGIGLGEEEFRAESMLESEGSAYTHSEQAFKQVDKANHSLFFVSDWTELNECLNSGMELLTALIGQWSSNQAKLALALLDQPHRSQEEIASLFRISQSAVSQRKKRAHLDPVEQYLQFSERTILCHLQNYAAYH